MEIIEEASVEILHITLLVRKTELTKINDKENTTLVQSGIFCNYMHVTLFLANLCCQAFV